jgi:LmbE family N-acetylglucosaminyl deacetylase
LTDPHPLTLIDPDVGRVLAVVAHPDDLEYGASAAIARWTDAGRDVAYVLVTQGEAGINALPPERCGPLREREQREAASIVGVTTVEFLDHDDGTIVADLALRADLAGAIRRHRPDTVVTINHRDHWSPDGGGRNSADHRALGEALLDAVADAANRWIFPGTGGEPHRVTRTLVANSPRAGHAIDVSGQVERAIASLAAHATYLEGLGDHPMADPTFLREILEATGSRAGVDAAVAVEVFEH